MCLFCNKLNRGKTFARNKIYFWPATSAVADNSPTATRETKILLEFYVGFLRLTFFNGSLRLAFFLSYFLFLVFRHMISGTCLAIGRLYGILYITFPILGKRDNDDAEVCGFTGCLDSLEIHCACSIKPHPNQVVSKSQLVSCKASDSKS